jgi:glutamate-1-semialdehyde 2,1-aminomutase
MGTGQKLWKRAKHVIPGGNMLLSKRAEMFLPEQWPAYFSKAKGCKVWDLDGNEYIDMCIMGIGTNTLGYGHPEVDESVRKTIEAGNMSTLNCPEEVFLAEKLVEIHPWAEMVRLARSGGEANAIAIRIARAASGKDKVAVCGYHGWHDWYLSANLGDDENLAGHLLPGLDPRGVPQNLRGTVYPFNYNKFDELEELVNQHDIGVIKMEVVRNREPEENFLQKVRKLATERGIVLIFDECTSGFRETFGGLHKKYGVEPDMAMFGKALGNGYGIRSWDTITQIGLQIRQRWQQLADKHEIKITHWGLAALTGFTFEGPQSLEYKTLMSQEMLRKGYLVGNSLYACTAHTQDIVDGYFHELDAVFELIARCQEGLDVNTLLKGPVCHGGFKRLN